MAVFAIGVPGELVRTKNFAVGFVIVPIATFPSVSTIPESPISPSVTHLAMRSGVPLPFTELLPLPAGLTLF
jgi:hypothetical protein